MPVFFELQFTLNYFFGLWHPLIYLFKPEIVGLEKKFNSVGINRVLPVCSDFFRGPVVDNVRLQGLEHVYMFTAHKEKIYIRSYRLIVNHCLTISPLFSEATIVFNKVVRSPTRRIALKKSGSRTPRVELEEIGPSLDLCLRRTKLASDDLYRRALRQPKTAKVNDYFVSFSKRNTLIYFLSRGLQSNNLVEISRIV